MRFRILGVGSGGWGAGAWVKQLRKGAKKGEKYKERRHKLMATQIGEQADAIHSMATTDKDVEMLRQRLEALTEAINSVPPQTPLQNFFARMGASELVMMLSEISATTHMSDRMKIITRTIMPEAVSIQQKAESLEETISVAEMAVGLAYEKEFATGSGRSAHTLVEVLKKMVQTKSGMIQPKAIQASKISNPDIFTKISNLDILI